ncbi:MAG: hypothetical protein PWP76_280 [Candidatus Diapherotrites archaeon]|nr:hypothetical protein [Candidatus Diapherotrites archaeon]MDN5366749.1 hypothetical protein [Candidatus Diapherotrites archaeon]
MRAHFLALLLVLPLAAGWVYPHRWHFSANPGEHITLCATAFSDSNSTITLRCGADLVDEKNIPANVPTVLCFEYAPRETVSCVWSDGANEKTVRIDVFPHAIVDAVLAVLLVVLVIRFAVRLVKIYL